MSFVVFSVILLPQLIVILDQHLCLKSLLLWLVFKIFPHRGITTYLANILL